MIHQFKNNGYNIVLDVNSGAIHVVDDLTYDIIGMYEEEDQDRIRERMAEKYPKVSEADIEEVFAELKALIDDQSLFTPDHYETYMDDVLKRRPTVVKALCLNVAHDCNLACKYCFADEGTYCGGPRELMSFETGKNAFDFLIANSGNRRNLEVDFFGGEPLMNWEVVKKLVAYGRQEEKLYDKKFRFTLTTNGVLLNDEIQDFLNREMSNVVLSIDGRKKIHNQMRPFRGGQDSYDRIVPKFQRLAESRGQERYYARGTFTRNNLDFSQDVLHIADLGFKQISVEPVVAQPTDDYALREEDLPKLFAEYDRLAAEMVRRMGTDEDFNFFHFMIPVWPSAWLAAAQAPSTSASRRTETSIPAISLPETGTLLWATSMTEAVWSGRISAMNSSSVMSTPRTSAGIASPNSTAPAAAQPMPIISRERSTRLMIWDVPCSRSGLSAPS